MLAVHREHFYHLVLRSVNDKHIIWLQSDPWSDLLHGLIRRSCTLPHQQPHKALKIDRLWPPVIETTTTETTETATEAPIEATVAEEAEPKAHAAASDATATSEPLAHEDVNALSEASESLAEAPPSEPTTDISAAVTSAQPTSAVDEAPAPQASSDALASTEDVALAQEPTVEVSEVATRFSALLHAENEFKKELLDQYKSMCFGEYLCEPSVLLLQAIQQADQEGYGECERE